MENAMRQQNHLVLTTNCTIFITLIKSFSIRPLLFRHPTSKPVRTYLLGLVLFYEEEAGKLQLKRYYSKSNFFKKQRKFKITTRSCDIHQDKLQKRELVFRPTHHRHIHSSTCTIFCFLTYKTNNSAVLQPSPSSVYTCSHNHTLHTTQPS